MTICQVQRCIREASTEGLCRFHALHREYQVQVIPGQGLSAQRIGESPDASAYATATVASAARRSWTR